MKEISTKRYYYHSSINADRTITIYGASLVHTQLRYVAHTDRYFCVDAIYSNPQAISYYVGMLLERQTAIEDKVIHAIKYGDYQFDGGERYERECGGYFNDQDVIKYINKFERHDVYFTPENFIESLRIFLLNNRGRYNV